MASLKLAVLGASGRMGRTLVRLIAEADDLTLAGAVERAGAADLGRDAGELAGTGPLGVTLTDDLKSALAGADALIDFTAPAATLQALAQTRTRKCAHIIGTTGFADGDLKVIDDAAGDTVIVRAGNFSLGVNLLCALVERAARALPEGFDIEIAEMHHRHKVDAPSGTALMLGEAAAKGRGTTLDAVRTPAREGITGAREAGRIGFAALRGGSVIGEHSVILAGEGERIELTHRAEDRALFAQGALQAARWAKDQAPGHYSMADVLGL